MSPPRPRRAAELPRHLLNPRIAGLRLSVLLAHYRARLRRQLAVELLAGAGIVVGVALVFGALLASSNVTGSAGSLIRSVDGSARLALVSRSDAGMSEALALRAGGLPGVKVGALLLRENGEVVGPGGRRSVQLVGLTSDIIALHSGVTRNLGASAALLHGGIGLSAPLAHAVGASASGEVTLFVGGQARRAHVRAVLTGALIGPAAEAPIAVGLLEVVQRLVGQRHRVSEVLIEPKRRQTARVARELRALAGGRLTVQPASRELNVLEQTAKPLGEATGVFAAIGAMVGLLLALNAMLLTLPERRRIVAELFMQGFDPRQIEAIVLFQSLLLGVLASALGLLLGDLLAHTIFQSSPVYLAAAFPIATRESISAGLALLAFAGGVLAATLASLPPLLDLRLAGSLRGGGLRRSLGRGPSATDPVRGTGSGDSPQAFRRLSSRAGFALGALGVLLLAIVTLLVLVDPALTILGGILLALAVPCFVPVLFAAALRVLKAIGRRARGGTLALAAIELNATAARSIALIGVASLAVYGSVAIEGARQDLGKGLNEAVVEFLDTAPVWVAPSTNFLTINSFNGGKAAAMIRRTPGVAAVHEYAGGLLDVGDRRLWIRARSPADSHVLQASQLLQGGLARASARIRRGGWAAISNQFAAEHALDVGDVFTLPTPSGAARFDVAAITTNTGWSPGAITIDLADYRRYWRTPEASALEVLLKPGVSPALGARDVRRALASVPGLRVQTLAQREASFEDSAREGLRSLSEISTLLLITAALAVAAVLGASIWQRRARLAALKAQGFDHLQLWRAVVLESGLAVAIGCVDGVLVGLYGHALASRWLSLSTGFPAPFSLGIGAILLALAIVVGVTIVCVAVLGFQSARVSPDIAFQDQA